MREKNLLPGRASRGGGHNLNRKFKTFGFLDTLKVHIDYTVQLPSERKQQICVFNTLHFSVSDLKSVIALSSNIDLGRGTRPLAPPPVYALY